MVSTISFCLNFYPTESLFALVACIFNNKCTIWYQKKIVLVGNRTRDRVEPGSNHSNHATWGSRAYCQLGLRLHCFIIVLQLTLELLPPWDLVLRTLFFLGLVDAPPIATSSGNGTVMVQPSNLLGGSGR